MPTRGGPPTRFGTGAHQWPGPFANQTRQAWSAHHGGGRCCNPQTADQTIGGIQGQACRPQRSLQGVTKLSLLGERKTAQVPVRAEIVERHAERLAGVRIKQALHTIGGPNIGGDDGSPEQHVRIERFRFQLSATRCSVSASACSWRPPSQPSHVLLALLTIFRNPSRERCRAASPRVTGGNACFTTPSTLCAVADQARGEMPSRSRIAAGSSGFRKA